MAVDYDRIEAIEDEEKLDEMLSEPTPWLANALEQVPGDILILGVAGKMGPTLARMAVRAGRRVIGVARFSNPAEEQRLRDWGIDTIKADLLDQAQLDILPDAPNVIYMAGMKFGSTGQEALTWAMNTYLPGMVAQRYRHSRIAAFSTGNVYGLSPVAGGGSREGDALNPTGEYAMSCVGRERILEHFSRRLSVPMTLLRLNYATEMRYGVLVDLARRVWAGETIDISMGYVNVIWQADANAMALASLAHTAVPPMPLNIAGPEVLSVREVCETFGRLLSKSVTFCGKKSSDALLNNGTLGHKLLGPARVSPQRMMVWIADWTRRGGASLGKPTHFEVRSGKF